jgi:hypothetical protein
MNIRDKNAAPPATGYEPSSGTERRQDHCNKNARLLSIEAGQRVEFTVLWADGRDYTKRFHRHSAKLLSGLADMASLARLGKSVAKTFDNYKRQFYFMYLTRQAAWLVPHRLQSNHVPNREGGILRSVHPIRH